MGVYLVQGTIAEVEGPSKVDLLIKVACFVTGKNILNIKNK
jgi:hypothetical protein